MDISFRHRIQVPDRPSYLVSRPHLTATLQGVAERQLLTLTAPAGYGKTSTLIDFAHTAPPHPVCWYTLSTFDRDPWLFLTYLQATLAQHVPPLIEVLQQEHPQEWDMAKLHLFRVLDRTGQHLILVLDDWHLVDSVAAIRELVTELLTHCPRCHVVLSSRVHPSLPNLMLLAGRRQVVGIDERMLRAEASEVASMLAAGGEVVVHPTVVEQLTTQMDGWITGILLGYGAPPIPDSSPTVLEHGLIDSPVYQFFAEQIFDRQSAEVQAFLLEAALLDDLTVEQCEQVLQRTDAWRILKILHTQRIFITEVDMGVLRYHPLFREFLQQYYRRTQPQAYRETVLRIATWYRDHEHWSRAFEMYVLADDLRGASAVISVGSEYVLRQGYIETLDRWFDVIPLELLDATALCLYSRLLIEYRSNYPDAVKLAHIARSRAQPSEMARVLLIDLLIARHAEAYEKAIEVGKQVLKLSDDTFLQSMALRIVSTCQRNLGVIHPAIEELKHILVLEHSRHNQYQIALIQQDLGFCYEALGKFQRAEEYVRKADVYWSAIQNGSRRALSLNNLGVLQHLIGRYQEAIYTLQDAAQYAQDNKAYYTNNLIRLSQGDLLCDLQQWELAATYYDNVLQTGASPDIDAYLTFATIRLCVRQRDYTQAATLLASVDYTTHSQGHQLRLLQACLLVAQGDYEQAHVLIGERLQATVVINNPMEHARIYLTKAVLVAAQYPEQPDLLVTALNQAAEIADQCDSDTFLALDLTLSDTVLHRAAAAGWPRAPRWLAARAEAIEAGRDIVASEDFGTSDQPEPAPEPTWELRALGSFQCLRDGEMCDLTPVQQALLTCIVDVGPAGVTEEVLLEQVYGDAAPGSIRSQMSRIRKATGLALSRQDRRYTVTEAIWYDVAVFEHTCQVGTTDTLEQAIELYQGDFLPALSEPSHWLVTRQLELQTRYLDALERLAQFLEETQPEQALTYYQQVWRRDPYRERAARRLIALAQQLHNHTLAQQVTSQLQQHLATLDVGRSQT